MLDGGPTTNAPGLCGIFSPPLSLNSAILITFLAPETLHLLLLFPGLVTLDDFVSECGKSWLPPR